MPVSYNKPTPGTAEDTWGTLLNNNFTAIENAFNGTIEITPDMAIGYWKIDGEAVTATAAELNELVNVTATTDELNYSSGVTSAIQTQIDDLQSQVDDVESSAITLSDVYPVGSIYINASDSSNPANLLGFGTWEAFGAGRVPVGVDSADTDFETAGNTGGAKTHTLTVDEMPAHDHNWQVTAGGSESISGPTASTGTSNNGNDLLTPTTSTGGDEPHNNLQPYIVVHMWKRTA